MDSLIALDLRLALDHLVNQIPCNVIREDGNTVQIWDVCLLDQLDDAMMSSGEAGGISSGGFESKPPVSMDALALVVEIRDAISRAWFANVAQRGTASDLRAIVDVLVRAHTPATMIEWTKRLDGWAARIRDLSGTDRARARSLPIECPRCGLRWQYVDADDETTRRAAISATFKGGELQSLNCVECGSWERGPALDALVAHILAA